MNIILKEYTEEHVCLFYEKTNNEEVMKWMYRPRTTLQDALDEWNRFSGFRNAIYVDGIYVGDIWLRDQLLGCCIFDMSYWNRGVASRALSMFLCKYDLSKVGAFVYAENIGSRKVLEKLDFKCVHRFEEKGRWAFFYRWERENGSEN